MKILFVHDHRFRRVGDKYYSTGGLTDDVLGRYSKYCDSVTVIARVFEEKSANEKWSEIQDPKVSIRGNSSLSYKELDGCINDCDAIIVRLPSFLGLRALRINNRIKKPYIIELVGCAWDALWNHSLLGKLAAPYAFATTRKIIKRSPWVLYVTKQFLQSRYPTNGMQIACSDVVLDSLDETVLDSRIKRVMAKKTSLVIGTIGALDVTYKGQDTVIRALGELHRRGNDAYEYQLVGNGDCTRLKRIAEDEGISDKVTIIGGLPHHRINEWLDNIDIYIQPSKLEGLPRSLIEAMSRGVPSFGTNVGGIPELLPRDCLIPRGRNARDELVGILDSINSENMGLMAECCFSKASEYRPELLDANRNQFYASFFNSVKTDDGCEGLDNR